MSSSSTVETNQQHQLPPAPELEYVHVSVQHEQFNFDFLSKIFSKISIILASCSPYFYWMLSKEARGYELYQLDISFVSFETLSSIVQYFYTSRISIRWDNVASLIKAAYKLALKDLQVICRNFLGQNVDLKSFVRIENIARECQCQDLIDLVEYFICSHYEEVITSEEILSANFDQFHSIVSKNMPNGTEEQLLSCIVEWVRFDLESRQEHAFSLLSKVRFQLISQSCALQRIRQESWLKGDIQYGLLLETILDSRFLEEHHSSDSQSQSQVLVVIGLIETGYLDLEMYDFEKQTWIPGPTNFRITYNKLLSDATISGMKIYFVDEDSQMNIFDLSEPHPKWVKCSFEPIPTIWFNICIIDDSVYSIGGFGTSTGCVCELKSGNWKMIASTSADRRKCSLAALNGRLYAIGGNDERLTLNSVECYNPETNCWYFVPDMIEARRYPGVFANKDLIFVAGGKSFYRSTRQFEVFDSVSQNWSQLPSMNVDRGFKPGLISRNNLLYAVGGHNENDGYLDSIEAYDLEKNSWSMFPTYMITGKAFVSLALVDRENLKCLTVVKEFSQKNRNKWICK